MSSPPRDSTPATPRSGTPRSGRTRGASTRAGAAGPSIPAQAAGATSGPTSAAASAAAGEVWGEAAICFRAWADGDTGEGGLSGLVRVMTPVLWHVVRSYRLPHELAEDVVQTTWLALVRRRDAIEDPVAIGGWLTTTARREAWRVSKQKNQAIPVEDEEITFRLPRQRSAESAAVESDERDRLWRVVDGLPERCRRLLRIVAFENRPDYTRLAQTLDMPVGSIGPTRSRCLAKLRVALMQNDGTETGR